MRFRQKPLGRVFRRIIVVIYYLLRGKINIQIDGNLNGIKAVCPFQGIFHLISDNLLRLLFYRHLVIGGIRDGIVIITGVQHFSGIVDNGYPVRTFVAERRRHRPRQKSRVLPREFPVDLQHDRRGRFLLRSDQCTVFLRYVQDYRRFLNGIEHPYKVMLQFLLQQLFITFLFIRLRNAEAAFRHLFNTVTVGYDAVRRQQKICIPKLGCGHFHSQPVVRYLICIAPCFVQDLFDLGALACRFTLF